MGNAWIIRLLQPAEGSVTTPLQQVAWRGWDVEEKKGEQRTGDWWNEKPAGDRGLPRAVKLAWQRPGLPDGKRLVYTVRLEAQDGSHELTVLPGIVHEQVEVTNLRIGISYTWQVSGFSDADAPRAAAQSAVGRFSTHPAAPRWLDIPGITNVRDLGGWRLAGGGRLRQGLLLRGSEMNGHCRITAAGAERLMDGLGVRSDIDLRGEGEEWGPVLDTARVAYHNLPLASYDMIASLQYIPYYRKLFALLADSAIYPLYLHCWGGADRTGTVAFLIGALLGMHAADLRFDYELTSLSVWGERRANAETFTEMLATLALFAPDGSSLQEQVEGYLQVIGVTEGEIASIRAILTEKPAG